MAVPDPLYYYEAALLSSFLKHYQSPYLASWKDIEDEAIRPYNFKETIWFSPHRRQRLFRLSPLCLATLKVWDKLSPKLLSRNTSLKTYLGPPWFKPGEDSSSFTTWKTHNLTRFCDISTMGKLVPLANLQQKIKAKIPWLEYYQVMHLFQSTCKRLSTSPRPFEQLMLSDHLPNKRLISIIYEILSTLSPLPAFAYQKAWDKDFQKTLNFGFWRSIWDSTLYTLRCANIQMAAYKLLYRWHLTPYPLHKIYPGSSNACWKQCGEVGNFIHRFWACPKIQLFWKQVSDQLNSIIGIRPPFTPVVVFFYFTFEAIKIFLPKSETLLPSF